MLVIELRFLAGRFHATPWGRNVNEGVPEWPPSPYRLARALVDVWRRRRPDWQEERVLPILEALSGSPSYDLPRASAAHIRTFMSANAKDPTKKQLIFDAFVALEHNAKLSIGFDGDPPSGIRDDLADLLSELNYLGRAESWIAAQMVGDGGTRWNCVPMSDSASAIATVQVACLKSPTQYSAEGHVPARSNKRRHGNDELSWLDATCMSTTKFREEGWSTPPALLQVEYPAPSLVQPVPRAATAPVSRVHCARYTLSAKVLPRVTETVAVAERIRAHLMGIHKRLMGGEPAKVSARFSGKSSNGTPARGHDHAFFFPVDEDGDGRLDHLVVEAAKPFDRTELTALDRLRSIWQPGGRPDVAIVLASLSATRRPLHSREWISVTPFVMARHFRESRGPFEKWLAEEIARDCEHHRLPRPIDIRLTTQTPSRGHPIRWFEFLRSRKGQRPRQAYGAVLTFSESVAGPFSIGAGCHFGLGLFYPHDFWGPVPGQ